MGQQTHDHSVKCRTPSAAVESSVDAQYVMKGNKKTEMMQCEMLFLMSKGHAVKN